MPGGSTILWSAPEAVGRGIEPMTLKKTFQLGVAVLAITTFSVSAQAALVTQTITGSFNDGSFGLPAFPTTTPNPLGLTDATPISGFVSYDDSIVPGGGDGTVAFSGANFDFELNIGSFQATPASDSFGAPFPLLIFMGGQVAGIDLLQDNTNNNAVPCSGAFGQISVDWCEFGIGPGAFNGAGAQANLPNIIAFEAVQQGAGGNNTEIKFYEGLVQFSDPNPVDPIPEPGTMILLGTALAGLALTQKRRLGR